MQDIVLGLYVAGVAVAVLVYARVMQKLMRNEETKPTSFSFPENTKKIRRTKKKERVVEPQTSYLSVNDQIEVLTQKMLGSNDGGERRKLLDQIRELESQR